MIRLLAGDCLIELPRLAAAGERFHCCVTDPPYGLEFMGREWDGADGFRRSLNEADAGRDSVFGRTSRHGPEFRAPPLFQQWSEAWARAVYDVLLPGAFLLAFGGTRTYHRMVCAVEDAGFEIRDSIGWLFGSGFPKSLDVSKAIDKMRGAEREVISAGQSVKRMIPGADQNKAGWLKENGREFVPTETAAATPEAAEWDGWGTALKPAMELICVARKPLDGTVAANVLKHGCGGLNIDASRVATAEDLNGGAYAGAERRRDEYAATDTVDGAALLSRLRRGIGEFSAPTGRWPANVVHDGSEEVLAAFPEAPGQMAAVRPNSGNGQKTNGILGQFATNSDHEPRGDAGSAARFFKECKFSEAEKRFHYSSKADRADRADSKHPTVKPVDLMRWLVTLVCPPNGRLLDPFAGSGTTGEACMLAGFDCTLVERDPQHVKDIEHRIRRWSGLDSPLFANVAD